jgi:hypothetical protein
MLRRNVLSTAHCALWLLTAFVTSSPLFAAPPSIDRLSMYGLQSGATTTLAIDGDNLSAECQLYVHNVPIAAQIVKTGATAERVELEVAVDSSTPPGIYNLRLVTAEGVSNPLPVAVDSMPQISWGAEIKSLPVALSGSVRGNKTLSATFAAKKSQPIVLEVEAQRIGSRLRPVLHVYDDRRVQVAWANAKLSLGEDARVTFQPPADGNYTVEIHDAGYAAADTAYFRLKIGAFEYADIAIPAAVQVGTRQVLRFAGSNLPADAAAEFTAPQIISRPSAAWPVRPMLSGARPAMMVTSESQLLESPTASAGQPPQALPLPGGVTGRLSRPREEDRYLLSARAGKKIRLSLSAQRLGSPVDGTLVVLDGNGAELASADDGNRTADPSLEFAFPKDTKAVTVVVKDVLRRGGADYVYHLSAKQTDSADFSLSFDADRLQIPPTGNALLKVQAKRAGYDGRIALRLIGLPPGIQVAEGEVPAGSDVGFCLLSGVGAGPAFGAVNIVGEGEGPAETLIRQAIGPASGAAVSCPWLRADLGVAVTANAAPISLELAGPPEQLPSRLPLGGRVELPVTVARTGDIGGEVRLSLVSTQRASASAPVAMQNRRARRNRQSAAVETKSADLLRLEDNRLLGASNSQATAIVVVPHDLPARDYGLVIQGDLLSVDGKTVLATSYTRPRWMKAVIPFSVKLEKTNIQVLAGEGETGELVGTIARTDGFAGPITLLVEGLPQGLITPQFELKAGECDFRFPISLPYGVKAGEIKARLTSRGIVGPGAQNGISGVPVAISLNVVAGEKPKAEKPLTIFEDEEEFALALNEGQGLSGLSDEETYSGKYSLLVRQGQRFRTSIPGLSVKIRKNPGPGEYRYLRYAWKTVGTSKRICLQLIDDGQARNEPDKVNKYSFHAGSGPLCEGQAIVVDEQVPSKWQLVTRDLYADFGEFTLTGFGPLFLDGKSARFDHIHLGRSVADLDSVKVD